MTRHCHRGIGLLLAGCLAGGLAGCGRARVAISTEADPPVEVAAARQASPPETASPPRKASGEGFRFPGGAAGKELERRLPPRADFPAPAVPPAGPLPRRPLAALEDPSPPW